MEANGIIQATVLKKCDRSNHKPETNKACAAGTCQHTCEPGQVEECAHKWTVRYSVNSRQREASYGTLTEALVFQADLSTKKITRGALFTDPRAGAKKFGKMREEYVARLDIGADTLEVYERNYRGPARGRCLMSSRSPPSRGWKPK